ncbi:Mitochondrial fission protein [Pestalotiopsis sp. IQ-011]
MANPEDSLSSHPSTTTFGSNETALCIIPPREHWTSIDRLRMLYDKAYEKWPPHVNLIYPFVAPDSLHDTANIISTTLKAKRDADSNTSLSISLDIAGVFPHRHSNTIFIRSADANDISCLRITILESLGHSDSGYNMHMTIGQSTDINSDAHNFLMHKTSLVPSVSWDVGELCILVRETTQDGGHTSSQMRLWGTISLRDFRVHQLSTPSHFYDLESAKSNIHSDDDGSYATHISTDRAPFQYSVVNGSWEEYRQPSDHEPASSPDELKVASYNVLAEFHYPPSQARYPLVLSNILDASASSDVLVLQEVTDDFLCFLLADEDIRREYRFVTHASPDQEDIEPLPSHINVVVLSRWSFTWHWLPFRRKHKGSLVLQFDDVGRHDEDGFVPLILATVHLTCGLTDGSVAAKRSELQSILKHLAGDYAENPWILSGDFNITTSAATISAAVEKRAISSPTADSLNRLETTLLEAGLSDSWTTARLGNLESADPDLAQRDIYEAYEGEQGATFDPMTNELAAAIVGSGLNNRPQRYDRILFKAGQLLSIGSFNMFGRDKGEMETVNSQGTEVSTTYASDHWGVRCSFRLSPERLEDRSDNDTSKLVVGVTEKEVLESLADIHELKSSLAALDVFPAEEEFVKREQALKLLHATLEDAIDITNETSQNRTGVQFVIVPVGSYGLGVWTASSDVDCLCLGSISPKTFFALATQRLRRAAPRGVKVLRRVNALSGTMLELEVLGVKMDLQYCASALIAQTWPRAMQLPAGSPVFSLPAQTLAKLKPARDLYYLRRTVPDLAAFRTAFYLVKTWAKQRGIYAARFGYLGGIHIAVLLSRVCKLLGRDRGGAAASSVPTIIISFFGHYARFDWKRDMVFDPFFHARLRYVRTPREAMVVLGFHSPSLNVATAASPPSVRTIAEEFQRADRILSGPGAAWADLVGTADSGPGAFLGAYRSYVKIDVQFWGVSLAKGSRYVGWLESKCVMLLVDIGRRLPNVHARMWPARFVAADSADEEADYQGCYLVGLDRMENRQGGAMSREEREMARGSLLSAAQKFEDQMRADERYFDAASSWLSVSVARRAELGELRLDHRSWGEYTVGDDESDEEEEEDEVMEDDDDDDDTRTSASKKSKRRDNSGAAADVRPAYEGKFRSSADVISRIRWDPGMDSGDYLVGYEDRFLGIRERPLDQWKAEQTDEEFIPQHRIMYFKRASDGVVVWDRRARRDDVFGSGVRDDGAAV